MAQDSEEAAGTLCPVIGRIIVFGISGVGKTTACRSFVTRHPGVLYISAGELLREATRLPVEMLRLAEPKEIIRNQLLIGAALDHRLAGRRDADVIIDAHSIIDNDREIVDVPTDAIRSLKPSGLILLEASPEEIVRRRLTDGLRRPKRSLTEVVSQMTIARKNVLGYADQLEVPLEIATVIDGYELDGAVEVVVRRAGHLPCPG
jgi:adenylate kinase